MRTSRRRNNRVEHATTRPTTSANVRPVEPRQELSFFMIDRSEPVPSGNHPAFEHLADDGRRDFGEERLAHLGIGLQRLDGALFHLRLRLALPRAQLSHGPESKKTSSTPRTSVAAQADPGAACPIAQPVGERSSQPAALPCTLWMVHRMLHVYRAMPANDRETVHSGANSIDGKGFLRPGIPRLRGSDYSWRSTPARPAKQVGLRSS